MKPRLKQLSEQVVVITGASSGIGLVTARMAAQRGARLVLAARNGAALEALADELAEQGCEAVPVVADVGHADQVATIALAAQSRFGGFDTWVNNAGVAVYGLIERVPLADHRQRFETNFWGTVNGSLVAAEHLRTRGGALINVGSLVSDLAAPLVGMYAASKHAVKGFTDALRLELEASGAPVSVTLIKPAGIDTPFTAHARNYMEVEPKLPAPLYAPEVVARAILHAAENPVRDLFAGGAAKLNSAAAHWAPRLMDRLLERRMFEGQKTDRPAREVGRDGLYEAGQDDGERLGQEVRVHEASLYTSAVTHPRRTVGLLLGGSLAALALGLLARRRARSRPGPS